jgi:ABC-type oligopeptide transport system substrate-binding subunit
VTVATDRNPVKEATARYVVRVLKLLGIAAQVRVYPNISALYEAAGNPATHTESAVSGWRSDFPRASDFFGNLLTCASYQPRGFNLNSTGFCDPALDREMQRAQELAATDAAASARLWAQVDRQVVDAAPWVATLNGIGLELTSRRVANYQRHPQLGALIDQLWVR